MRFTRKFFIGMVAVIAGFLSAFNTMGDYRIWSIVIFWISMAGAVIGTILMYRGIDERHFEAENPVNQVDGL